MEIRARWRNSRGQRQPRQIVAYRKASMDALMASPLDQVFGTCGVLLMKGPDQDRKDGDLDSIEFTKRRWRFLPETRPKITIGSFLRETSAEPKRPLVHSEAYLRMASPIRTRSMAGMNFGAQDAVRLPS